MAKLSEENFYDRLRQLAEVKKTNTKESKEFSLSTLIDFKKANDGTVYGIVKENHHYYIKKSTNPNPKIEDFVYMSGLENIKEYQYPKLAEADKQRNMLIKVLNEALSGDQFKKTGKNKKIIAKKPLKTLNEGKVKEDKTTDDLDTAAKALDDLDVKVDAEKAEETPPEPLPDSGSEEPPADFPPVDDKEKPIEDLPVDDKEKSLDKLSPEEELPIDDKEKSADSEEPVVGDEESGNKDLVVKELEKLVGKFGEKAAETELPPVKAKALVKQFLSSIKDSIAQLDVEDRKDIADEYFMEVVPAEKIKDLESSVETEPDLKETEGCSECGTFENYAKGMGYESLEECPMEEMANLIGGYANAYNDGKNDGDFGGVAFHITPKISKELVNEYGHGDYIEKLQPYLKNVGEEGQKMPVGGLETKPELETEPNAIGEEPEKVETGEEIEPVVEPEIEKEKEISFAPAAQNLGGGVIGSGVDTPTKSVEVNLKDSTINMTMTEGEQKLRNYIRTRLEEKIKSKKSVINESKKSPLIKKLDEMIDKQINVYKTIVKKK